MGAVPRDAIRETRRATKTVSRAACAQSVPGADAGPPITAPPTTRVLTPSEAQSVENVIATVTYVEDGPSDGEDGEEWYLTTYDSAGSRKGQYSARRINGTPFPRAERVRDLYDALRRY